MKGHGAAHLRNANALLRAAEHVSMAAAGVGLFAIMGVIVVDVAARYLFKAPLAWSFDLIGLYLMPAVFYFALSDTLHRNHHINVDIVFMNLKPRVQQGLSLVGSVLVTGVFALIAYAATMRTVESIRENAVSSGVYPWPTWLSVVLVAFGAAMITLRLVFRAVAFGYAVVQRVDDVPGVEAPATLGEEP